MKVLAFFGICFIAEIVIIMLAALLKGIYWVAKKLKQRKRCLLEERLRDEFARRFPYFGHDHFDPDTTLQSPCCKAIMWKSSGPFQYFCDKCEKRYDVYKNIFTPLPDTKNLSDLHEYFKENTIKRAVQSRP